MASAGEWSSGYGTCGHSSTYCNALNQEAQFQTRMRSMRELRNQAVDLSSQSRRVFICLMAVVLLFRVLIPAGFIPTSSASSFMLTLCAGGGTVPVTFDLPAKPAGDTHLPSDTCAFGTLAAHVVLPEAALVPVLTAVLAFTTPAVPTYHPAPALPPLGPPLGSRAPPLSYSR